MKKISLILSIAILLTALLNSCKVEDNSLKQLNENGMVLTSYWQAATYQALMSTPNTALHLNAWLSAPESAVFVMPAPFVASRRAERCFRPLTPNGRWWIMNNPDWFGICFRSERTP